MAFYFYIRWELNEWAVVGLVILFSLEAVTLCSLLNSVRRIAVNFTAKGINGDRLPQDIEYSLYRVAQECLTNIRRHANCETASMSLTRTSNAVVMKVRDSGSSQKLSKIKDLESGESVGVGISGMNQRLLQLGGKLKVASDSSGTTVTATVPITDQ